MRDEVNPDLMFQGTHQDLLAAAARGEIDLQTLASKELANRGLDGNGRWVGFAEAKRLHQQRMEERTDA